jgi:tRNA-specific 2-thiouridylase
MNNKRVVVGLSGGVDSSVAAYLLKEKGYEVIGLFMKNWHDDSVTISSECPWLEDSNDAMLVAEKIGIPFQTVDLSKEYKTRIVDYMFSEYSNGRTPNPDVLCNREIKFDLFLKIAISLGANFIATGHYCIKSHFKNKEKKNIYKLISGKDKNKDQSYFLCQLNQQQLSKVLFPIGGLKKDQVRKIAKEQKLITADKKDSQGLCFIGKVKLPDFLKQKLKPKKGAIIEIPSDYVKYKNSLNNNSSSLRILASKFSYNPEDGLQVGRHQGAHYYTIGQRKGLSIGGTIKPLFIIDTDVETNTIFVGQGKSHPGLHRYALLILKDDIHWVRSDLRLCVGDTKSFDVRIRYRQTLQKAILYRMEEGLYISFEKKQSAITPGQFAVWYENDELIGSGVIS